MGKTTTCGIKPSVGQLVKWKPGLRNRALPADNQPAIVRKVLDTPLTANFGSHADPLNSYYLEPLDLVVAFLGPEGEFGEFHFDSRRFEPAE
jgi:hypothetical protein